MSEIRQHFSSRNQGHVFGFADQLEPEALAKLESQASDIDLDEVERLVETLVKSDGGGGESIGNEIAPAPFVPLPHSANGEPDRWAAARELGEEALRAGRVAAFTVAGGQGTRLGYDGPKGTFGVTPVLKKSLFQVFAEKVLASSQRYGKTIHWFILTSQLNHEATIAFFEEHHYFGLEEGSVHFFSQGMMPAVDGEGKIFLADKSEIALSPDGHGGALRALVRSGSIAKMEELGVDVISYFQVDNPLVRCIDPAFIGLHLAAQSELSSKMVPKAYAAEKVGVFCERGEKLEVIEYSDLPEELSEQTDADGNLRFIAGSIAIHLFDRDFVKRLGGGESSVSLPFHLANKKIAHLDESGTRVEPEEPNGFKFEMFVFDALPFATNPIVIETAREDDFSPVKNAEGVDSPESSREDQLRQFARWAAAAGVELVTDDTGLPAVNFEVSPLFADSEEAFVERWQSMSEKPDFVDGLVLV
ncbi:MAG: UDPGP type 1 family protein [Verrucomicrobiota bacterium]